MGKGIHVATTATCEGQSRNGSLATPYQNSFVGLNHKFSTYNVGRFDHKWVSNSVASSRDVKLVNSRYSKMYKCG